MQEKAFQVLEDSIAHVNRQFNNTDTALSCFSSCSTAAASKRQNILSKCVDRKASLSTPYDESKAMDELPLTSGRG